MAFISAYFTFFVAVLLTTIFERSHIHSTKRWRIIANIFTFPLFMLTYIPINLVALFKKVEWVPTKHEFAMSVDQITSE